MKIHLLETDDPNLKEGADLKANCGSIVKNSVFAMKFDFDLGDVAGWNSLRICQNCKDFALTHRFIYGIVNGQEQTQ